MTEMTFDLYATGQYAENYGAHDWDGEGQCPQYWKMKGSGEVLAMQNVTLANLPEAIKEVEARLSELGHSDDYSSLSCSSVVYFPAGASYNTKSMIEYGIEEGQLTAFSTVTPEEIALAERFRRFMGLDHDSDNQV